LRDRGAFQDQRSCPFPDDESITIEREWLGGFLGRAAVHRKAASNENLTIVSGTMEASAATTTASSDSPRRIASVAS